jgi:hypothetical protein
VKPGGIVACSTKAHPLFQAQRGGKQLGTQCVVSRTGLTGLRGLQDFAKRLSDTVPRNPVHPEKLDNPVFKSTRTHLAYAASMRCGLVTNLLVVFE